jgi:hypothetical protein
MTSKRNASGRNDDACGCKDGVCGSNHRASGHEEGPCGCNHDACGRKDGSCERQNGLCDSNGGACGYKDDFCGCKRDACGRLRSTSARSPRAHGRSPKRGNRSSRRFANRDLCLIHPRCVRAQVLSALMLPSETFSGVLIAMRATLPVIDEALNDPSARRPTCERSRVLAIPRVSERQEFGFYLGIWNVTTDGLRRRCCTGRQKRSHRNASTHQNARPQMHQFHV